MKIWINNIYWLFSSPEHKKLKVSYWGGSLSVRPSVRPSGRPASTISLKIFFSKTTKQIDLKLDTVLSYSDLILICSFHDDKVIFEFLINFWNFKISPFKPIIKAKSLNDFFSKTTEGIHLKLFTDVPCINLTQICSWEVHKI